MQYLDSISAVSVEINRFMVTHGSALDEHVRELMIDAVALTSPVDVLIRSLEILWANREALPAEGKLLAAQIASFVMPYNWHGINEDNRGQGIVLALLRDLGEEAPLGVTYPAPDADPAPKEEFLPPAPESEEGGESGDA